MASVTFPFHSPPNQPREVSLQKYGLPSGQRVSKAFSDFFFIYGKGLVKRIVNFWHFYVFTWAHNWKRRYQKMLEFFHTNEVDFFHTKKCNTVVFILGRGCLDDVASKVAKTWNCSPMLAAMYARWFLLQFSLPCLLGFLFFFCWNLSDFLRFSEAMINFLCTINFVEHINSFMWTHWRLTFLLSDNVDLDVWL